MRTIFDLIANEWKPWFRRFTWLPGKQQNSWANWFSFLRIWFGDKLTEDDVRLFQLCTGRTDRPKGPFHEGYLICGRRSAKSRMLGMIGSYLAVFRDWSKYLSPGEKGTVRILSADRRQSRTIFGYCAAFLKALDVDTVAVERETMDTLQLANGITIEIGTADFRTVRGYTVVAALLDEAAFWSDEGQNPDEEILRALRPAMATVPGAVLLVASSPYRKSGILYDGWRRNFGKNGADALCWVAPTRLMNPTVGEAFIAGEIEKDPEGARSEYVTTPEAPFRDDISSLVASDVIDAATMRGVVVIPPDGKSYTAFLDLAGSGTRDSHAIGISFKDEHGNAVSVCGRDIRSPNVESVAAEFSAIIKSYGLSIAYADDYGQQWSKSAFARYGIELRSSPYTRSEIYLNVLPQLNSGKVKLLDLPRLRQQLLALERKTSITSGRDAVIPGSPHDDLANAICGGLAIVSTRERRPFLVSDADRGDVVTMAEYNRRREGAGAAQAAFLAEYRREQKDITRFKHLGTHFRDE
jgi:hypothetical protein